MQLSVSVLEPPSFPPGAPVEFKVRAGERMELPCPVLGDPEPFVFWKKDGMPVSLSHTMYVTGKKVVHTLAYHPGLAM